MTKHNMSLSVDFEVDNEKVDIEKFKRHLFHRCLQGALELMNKECLLPDAYVHISVTDTVEE